jgi:hypothetical protein
MDPNKTSEATFSGSTSAIGKALLDAPVMRPWPPTLEEARGILTGQPYEVLERIGHGGMGAVFKVRNLEPGMERIEAVKIRRPEARDDDLFRERFLREIGTLAQLRHPGITTIYRSGDSAEGYLWFSMEFLEGQPLAGTEAGQKRPGAQALIQLTDLGVFWKLTNGHLRTTVFSMTTGQVIPDASVALLKKDFTAVLASATTDATGTVSLPVKTNPGWLTVRSGEDTHALHMARAQPTCL